MSKKTDKKPGETRSVGRTMHYYWREIVKYKWFSLGMLISTPVVIFIRSILGPLIFAYIVDRIATGLPADQILPTLFWPAVIYIACSALNNLVLGELRLYWTWRMELLAMYDLSSLCFDTICAQSMQFHSNHFSGSLVSQTNKFVGSFERLIDGFIWNAYPIAIYLVMVVVVLLPTAPWFVPIILGLVTIYTTVSALSFRRISDLNDAAAAADTRQTGQLADSISNIISVKSYARESHERHRYANFQRSSLNAAHKLLRATLSRDLVFSFINVILIGFLLVFLLFGSTWFGISIATLILIVNYSQGIMSNLWDINHIFKDFNRIFGDAHEMTTILDTVDDVVDRPDAKTLTVSQGAVDFNHITFQYQEGKEPIFQDFSLFIQPGERIGLVGVSGSGKTTLTKLLLRFADVNAGDILVDGQDISAVTQSSLREVISYVPQETSLFHRSIADNIAYACPGASREQIIRAAKLANAHEFIKDLPEGYETLVGERGVKLSGGQRQRIAIARAILKDSPVLVLDEATSALDSESEALIQDALTKLMKNRTSVVIAHRLSTVAGLDRIVVLSHGKIVEQGTHQELLNKSGGAYQQLWSRQSGAFLEED